MAVTADVCEDLAKNWDQEKRAAMRLEMPQLLFVWGTVVIVLVAAALAFAGILQTAAITAGAGVLTGAAAAIVTTQLNAAQKRADRALNKYVKQCSVHPEPARRMEALLPN